MKVLVVDDEAQIRKLLQTGLEGYGYEVFSEADGNAALVSVAQQKPDVVILDITLGSPPDGMEVCHNLRMWSKVPILMLSVHGEEKQKVRALNTGADDYLTKPFGMEELNARIQAILRRSAITDETTPMGEIRAKGLVIDLVNRRVTLDGEAVHFTPKEYDLLCLLATHPGKVITHGTLLHNIWGADHEGMDHYVRGFVNQIRKKLKENPARGVQFIISEPGVGYRFIDAD
jgi:two-component system KDP operon response regulator KdpE